MVSAQGSSGLWAKSLRIRERFFAFLKLIFNKTKLVTTGLKKELKKKIFKI